MHRSRQAQKAGLTRAINSGDPAKVIAEVELAYKEFDISGWPDDWANWERALLDAQFKLRQAA